MTCIWKSTQTPSQVIGVEQGRGESMTVVASLNGSRGTEACIKRCDLAVYSALISFFYRLVAQMVEQRSPKPPVVGSSPVHPVLF